jgi:4-amino-4-deoxy-L-arabinose transferase-like glycosyltransferase
MTRSNGYQVRTGWLAGRLIPALPFVPLLVSLAPRSVVAHDEGYYALQARWLQESGVWLAPLWWDQPLFDRTIGVQWLIGASQQLLGPSSWAAHLPSLLAAIACLVLTGLLGRRLLGHGFGWLSAALLALTPLWLNYAHQSSQDMPLLAFELLGAWAILQANSSGRWGWCSLAGLWLGPAFLVKGFMVAVPAAALLPLIWLERRFLLRRRSFWAGLLLGWLPVLLWLGLSLQRYGSTMVGGLLDKLLYLSASDVYSAGPFYYFWNITANTAPWSLAALAGLILSWRHWRAEQRQLLAVYPLLLLLLLSCFRTKTPYYGLQLTPYLALWAAAGLQRFSAAGVARPRWLAWALAGLGGVLLIGGGTLILSPGISLDLLPLSRPLVAAAAALLGLSWLLLPRQHSPRRTLAALLIGPWLALVLLVQGGLFTDRSPLQRLALAQPQVQAALRQGEVAVVSDAPLTGEAHSQLILVALASPKLGPKLNSPTALRPGQWAWIQRDQLAGLKPPLWSTVASGDDLAPWTLVRRNR